MELIAARHLLYDYPKVHQKEDPREGLLLGHAHTKSLGRAWEFPAGLTHNL